MNKRSVGLSSVSVLEDCLVYWLVLVFNLGGEHLHVVGMNVMCA